MYANYFKGKIDVDRIFDGSVHQEFYKKTMDIKKEERMRFDLVLIRHNDRDTELFLFKAPACSGLAVDEDVIVETQFGKKQGKVVYVLVSVEEKDDVYKFIKIINKDRKIKKVLGKLEYKEFNWEQENGLPNAYQELPCL